MEKRQASEHPYGRRDSTTSCQYIAAYEGRSDEPAGPPSHCRTCIRAFEKEHGPIDLEDKP